MNRGDVYRIKAGRNTRGHEQAGPRYGVIVQTDVLPLSTVLVVPTSTSCDPASFRPVIDIGGQETRAMTEQTTALDPEKRFADHVGRVSLAEMQAIEAALRRVLAL